jgi:hypothetical protein
VQLQAKLSDWRRLQQFYYRSHRWTIVFHHRLHISRNSANKKQHQRIELIPTTEVPNDEVAPTAQNDQISAVKFQSRLQVKRHDVMHF